MVSGEACPPLTKWEHINLTGDYHSRKDAVELEFGGASVLAARLWFN